MAAQLLSGSGDPNGVEIGNEGDLYQDQSGPGKLWICTAAPTTWKQASVQAFPDITDTPGVLVKVVVPTEVSVPTFATAMTPFLVHDSVIGGYFSVTSDGVNSRSARAESPIGSFEVPTAGDGTAIHGMAPGQVDNNLNVQVSVWEVDPQGAGCKITGFAKAAYQPLHVFLYVYNANGTNNLTLQHENAGSLADNRMRFVGGVDLVIPPDGGCTLLYAETSVGNRWISVGVNK